MILSDRSLRPPGTPTVTPLAVEIGPVTAAWRWILRTPVIHALVLANILMYAIPHAAGGKIEYAAWDALEMSPNRFWGGEWWRVVTSGFVHADWDHVLGNMIFLLPVGLRLERKIGSANLTRAYLICQVGSCIPLAFSQGETIGASGAIFGLMGVLLICPVHQDHPRRRHTRVSWTWLLLALFTGWALMGEPEEQVSLLGHLGGLITGLLVGASLSHMPGAPLWSRGDRVLAALAVTFVLLGALSMLQYWGSP